MRGRNNFEALAQDSSRSYITSCDHGAPVFSQTLDEKASQQPDSLFITAVRPVNGNIVIRSARQERGCAYDPALNVSLIKDKVAYSFGGRDNRGNPIKLQKNNE